MGAEAWPLVVFVASWLFFPSLVLVAEGIVGVGEGMIGLQQWPPKTSCTSSIDIDRSGFPCHNDRPAWQGSMVLPGDILFVSIGFYGHAVPLLAIAEEIANRGHTVTFATHDRLRDLVVGTPGVSFLSAGRMPIPEEKLRSKLKSLSQVGGFWGLLTLLNDVYLTLEIPMYHNLLEALELTLEQHEQQSQPSMAGGLADVAADGWSASYCDIGSDHSEWQCPQEKDGHIGDVEKVWGVGEEEIGTSQPGVEDRGNYGDTETLCSLATDKGQVWCDPVDGVDGGVGGVGGVDGVGGVVVGGGAPPFDLMVLDMGTLGGLDLAHKLGVPYMFNSPSLLFDLSGQHVSATLPGWGTGMARKMSMWERLQNVIFPRALSVFLTPAFIGMNKARREIGLEPFHAQDDIFFGARILVNTAFGLEYRHSLGPLVEMTGPLLPPAIARELSASSRSLLGAPTLSHTPGDKEGKVVEGKGDRGVVGNGEEGEWQEEWGSGALALPFLISSWLRGSSGLVAPGTLAAEAASKAAKLSGGWDGGGGGGTAAAKSQLLEDRWFSNASVDKDKGVTASDSAAMRVDMGAGGQESLREGGCGGGGEEQLEGAAADSGVILINLGHMPQFEKWQLLTIIQALSGVSDLACWGGGGGAGRAREWDDMSGGGDGLEFNHRVLWLIPKEQHERLLSAIQPSGLPSTFRVKVIGGLPHLAILAHPSVKVVVSHCGMGVAQEALVFGKPLLCLPVFSEQEDVTRRVVDAGAGLSLSAGNITSREVRESVVNLVSDPRFRTSAAVLSEILRRAGGTLRAANVVEATLQLGGSEYLKPLELRSPWHKSSGADVYVILLAGVILLAVCGYGALVGITAMVVSVGRRATNALRAVATRCEQCEVLGGKSETQSRKGKRRGGGRVRSGGSSCLVASSASAAAQAAAVAGSAAAAIQGSVRRGLVPDRWGEGRAEDTLDMALGALLGGVACGEEFPEDEMAELDGPAVDRSGDGMGGSLGGGSGNGSMGHRRSLSGELVVWPGNGEGKWGGDLRGWGGSSGVGHDTRGETSASYHKRWD